ncbi:MAG: hypothetical protein CVU11_02160 [Bacteroidetes bacterium HGW-Bacteroidetes-6]|jgi:hypothetical protein|nr:MAG: hypothetical protein CVU11_02160 [Bacteroidetes bacterium HGW-Bacteroidetes-6]
MVNVCSIAFKPKEELTQKYDYSFLIALIIATTISAVNAPAIGYIKDVPIFKIKIGNVLKIIF